MKRTLGFQMITWVIIVFISFAALPKSKGSASEFDFGPMYEYFFPAADVSLFIPVTADVNLQIDKSDQKMLMIIDKQIPDEYLCFFLLKNEYYKNKDISLMDDSGMREVLSMVSNSYETLPYTREKDELTGRYLLRTQQVGNDYSDNSYTEQLVALKDGWVLNALIQKFDGTLSLTDEAKEYQKRLLRSALISGVGERISSYTLPGTKHTLTLPQTVFMRIYDNDPNDLFIEFYLYKQGIQYNVLTLYAERNPLYNGKTVSDLDKEDLYSTLLHRTDITTINPERIISHVDDDDLNVYILYDDEHTYLLTLFDGWSLKVASHSWIAENINYWANIAKQVLIHQLKGYDEDIPDWYPLYSVTIDDNILSIPLYSCICDIDIPKGFQVQVQRETEEERDVYLYNPDDTTRYFYIYTTYEVKAYPFYSLTDLYTEKALVEDYMTYVSFLSEESGSASSAEFLPEDSLGFPLVHFTTENQSIEEYYWLTDSYFIRFGFRSEDGAITSEESQRLKDMLWR